MFFHRVYGPRKCETSSAAVVFFEQEPCQDDAIAPGASVLWRWLERCLESSSAPDIALLRDAVPGQKDRMRILAVLGDRTMGQVEGLHLTLDLWMPCGGWDFAASCYFRWSATIVAQQSCHGLC